MDYWTPTRRPEDVVFRVQTRARRLYDAGVFSTRSWVFRIADAYLPRMQIWPGDDLAVRFLVKNESEQEGVVYYIVRVSHAYDRRWPHVSTDTSLGRDALSVWAPAGATVAVQTLIPWGDLERLRDPAMEEMTLSVEIEIWTPRRQRMNGQRLMDRFLRFTRLSQFQRVALFANPTLLFRPPLTTAFLSYAWKGAARLGDNEHRAWVYAFGDALARAGVRATIDYAFLSPSQITTALIARHIRDTANVIVIYSDDYLDRIGRAGSGVSYEYGLLRADGALWKKTLPIRRHVFEREAELYGRESRFVPSFEDDDLTTATNMLVRHMRQAKRRKGGRAAGP